MRDRYFRFRKTKNVKVIQLPRQEYREGKIVAGDEVRGTALASWQTVVLAPWPISGWISSPGADSGRTRRRFGWLAKVPSAKSRRWRAGTRSASRSSSRDGTRVSNELKTLGANPHFSRRVGGGAVWGV